MTARAAVPAPLGPRLRELRLAAGLTQAELAGGRVSKEYVSQIERGKTRPTRETIEWLAARLRVAPTFLADGISGDERAKAETLLARAEALAGERRYPEAVDAFRAALPEVLASGDIELQLHALRGEALAAAFDGDVEEALSLLRQAGALAELPRFSDADRADVLYRTGVCRYLLSSFSSAVGLFGEALVLADRSEELCDRLRLDILDWRSRCFRRLRDYEAAREDVERALELAEALSDARALGAAYFQASALAERSGRWVLARRYAEKAKEQYEALGDRANVGRLLNNLGGLDFLLGNATGAIVRLKEAVAIGLEVGHDEEAAAAVASLAQVHLRSGSPETAEEQARYALSLLEGREDMLDHVGGAHLVLGRALLEQSRLEEAERALADAEDTFDRLSSTSHRAAAWLAQGDLAARRGDDTAAAALYRRAAETLQELSF